MAANLYFLVPPEESQARDLKVKFDQMEASADLETDFAELAKLHSTWPRHDKNGGIVCKFMNEPSAWPQTKSSSYLKTKQV